MIIRSSLLLFILFMTVNTLHAQTRRAGKGRSLGLVKIGIGVNYLSPLPSASTGTRIRFHIGVAPTFPLTEKVYFKPELAFSMKGGRSTYGSGIFQGEAIYRMSYLEMPLVIGFKPGKRVAVEAGMFGALNLGGDFAFTGNFSSGYGSFDSKSLHDADYGIVAGIKLGPLGIRYYHGLQPVAATGIAKDLMGDAGTRTVQIYLQMSRRNRLRNK